MIPTLLGITFACFSLIQFVPGGPVEQFIVRLQSHNANTGTSNEKSISEDEVENIKKYYGFDQPFMVRYGKWLGNIFKGNFGDSYFYEEPVLDVITQRFPISLFFGLSSFFLSYLICIPLGVKKALHQGSYFDIFTSVLTYIGYVIPSYALGILLIIFFCGGSFLDLFPMTGIKSDDHDQLSFFGQLLDYVHHLLLPLICYMASQFAVLSLLMKNSLLEEIKKEYVRSSQLRGASYKKSVMKHAFRNSLIPIATGLGSIFSVMFAGALLIERVFDIDGMGLLFYNSIVNRDYNVVMGLILLISITNLIGRLFSDLLYAWIDPRIRFN